MKKRIYALLLDAVFISIIQSVVLLFIEVKPISFGNISFLDLTWKSELNIRILFPLVYFLIFDAANNGITFGKRILNIRVVLSTGQPLTLLQRLNRSFLKWFFVMVLSLVSLLYYLIKSETIHDKIMGTKTIR